MLTSCKFLASRVLDDVRGLVGTFPTSPRLSVYFCSGPETAGYITSKVNAAKKVGIEVELINCDHKSSYEVGELIDNDCNNAIIVQLPWKDKREGELLIRRIKAIKDVDGLTKDSKFIPATALGIHSLLWHNNVFNFPQHIVLAGRSPLIGKPLAKLLLDEPNVTLTVINRSTRMPQELMEMGDVIVSATGKKDFIGPWMEFEEGTIIIDAGFSKDENGNIYGDVAEGTAELSEFEIEVTPVPGGVGLLTVAYLLKNVADAYRMQRMCSGC